MADTLDPVGGALELLFEKSDLPGFVLPPELAVAYGGKLGFERPCWFANFVASVDGVVALPVATESGHVISGSSEADRFVMGLLRACADTIVLGAGTFRKASQDVFRADSIYPRGKSAFAALRQRLNLAPEPRFVLVTRTGVVDVTGPALENALIVTTEAGASALDSKVSASTRVVALKSDPLRLRDLRALLEGEGCRLVLSEGGPSLVADLVHDAVLDELFLTTSPALFGRFPNDDRKSLTNGLDLAGAPLELLSLRRHESYLFSRYGLVSEA
jgi:riboflavin biosynthesis pyrimidine reductase